MPSPCGNHYGYGYIENRLPSQDGGNSYRPPTVIPSCSPEFSGYGYLGQDDYSQSSNTSKPPVPKPPSPKDDPNFPGIRPGAHSTDQNTNIIQSQPAADNTKNDNENIKKGVVIGGALLLSIIGIFVFGRNEQLKSAS